MKILAINESESVRIIEEDNEKGETITYYQKKFFGVWGRKVVISREFYNVTF